MSKILRKALKHYANDGLLKLLHQGPPYIYNQYIRRHLPSQTVTFNGVRVPANHWLDQSMSFANNFSDDPNYEKALIESLKENVEPGDKVVIVGGGWGVSAVVAAKQVGERGEVVVYEGSREYVEYIKKTIDINDVSQIVSVQPKVVAHAVTLRGNEGQTGQIHPEKLPGCDVLEMDCEGAELEILRQLEMSPRLIIVETHEVYDSPEPEIRTELTRLGYEVIKRGVEDKQNGVIVLTAIRTV